MRAADLDLLQQGYRRGYIAWEVVRGAIRRVLPPCVECGAPAVGAWTPGHALCAECAAHQLQDVAATPDRT